MCRSGSRVRIPALLWPCAIAQQVTATLAVQPRDEGLHTGSSPSSSRVKIDRAPIRYHRGHMKWPTKIVQFHFPYDKAPHGMPRLPPTEPPQTGLCDNHHSGRRHPEKRKERKKDEKTEENSPRVRRRDQQAYAHRRRQEGQRHNKEKNPRVPVDADRGRCLTRRSLHDHPACQSDGRDCQMRRGAPELVSLAVSTRRFRRRRRS